MLRFSHIVEPRLLMCDAVFIWTACTSLDPCPKGPQRHEVRVSSGFKGTNLMRGDRGIWKLFRVRFSSLALLATAFGVCQQSFLIAQEGAGESAAELAADAAAEALSDGSFRAGPKVRGEYQFSERTTHLWDSPWKVELGDIDVRVFREQMPYKGIHAVDLNGSRSGSIYQTLSLVPGQVYKVEFLAAGNWETRPNENRNLSVWLGWERVQFTLAPSGRFDPENPDWQSLSATFTATGSRLALRFRSDDSGFTDGTLISRVKLGLGDSGTDSGPAALGTLQVPLPDQLDDFIADRDAAVVLGKALFWDMQAGSDGKTACASCHYNAGADIRTTHTLEAGAPGSAFGPAEKQLPLRAHAIAAFRGNNQTLTRDDFPFQKLANPLKPANEPGFEEYGNPPLRSTKEVVGSQGVIAADFAGIQPGSPRDLKIDRADALYHFQNANVRRITGRNSPTNINAVFLDRLYWDGRANHYFNGVNPWGELDKNASVLKSSPTGGRMVSVRVLLNNAALASQAVAPIISDVEMSWTGREFADVGRKLFSLRPLALQQVAADDSILGIYTGTYSTGLDPILADYASLVRKAFKPEWWSSADLTEGGYTHMESNFSLFWGLSLLMYQSTLVSDQTPFDAYASGDEQALTESAKRGLQIFLNEGACINCHGGPQFAGGTVNSLPGDAGEAGVERMEMARGDAWYDAGFYNIGVRPTHEDIGLGAEIPGFGPISYSRREQQGQDPDKQYTIGPNERVAVDGAFKSPSLRNIELTGPYMHNGGFMTLEQVVQFYVRGADFFHTNIQDLDPDVDGIPSLRKNPQGIADLVEFMKHLTDQRVRTQAAPFDHPELILPNGHSSVEFGEALEDLRVLPATGQNGGQPLQTFEEALEYLNLRPLGQPATDDVPPAVTVEETAATQMSEPTQTRVPAGKTGEQQAAEGVTSQVVTISETTAGNTLIPATSDAVSPISGRRHPLADRTTAVSSTRAGLAAKNAALRILSPISGGN